eukprot:CAMPEP_0119554054 /NCGR_PEP_ID=MMETSP1352-20130426/6638_1 /TAXON_ID=265584 /ORGANISM="Stauroneis constricta, Strain CCMP1120" /LENGTH=225 /DNA_ID=CAMNT_0007600573 /DNA_START=58 /DNA_END=735 /DNA_ORIENTATION=+
MDPPECNGHSHDHLDNTSDGLGLTLRPQIDFDGVTCLNESIVGSGKSVFKLYEDRLTDEPHVQSQEDDPELLFYIPFTEGVTIQSISIRSVVTNAGNDDNITAPPRTIKLFANRDDIDFAMANEMEPQMELELLPPFHFVDGTIDYPLRPAGRFQGISSLTIFVANNYGAGGDDDDNDTSTLITYIGLKGRGLKMKRQVVETVYESRGMPSDHKVEGEFGNQQML